MSSNMEACVGCGALSLRHPWVAIAARGDVDGERIAEHEQWVAHPVCAACHKDPSRRKQRLKAHYCPRGEEWFALAAAGSDSIGG
jgi:hypothetical protein